MRLWLSNWSNLIATVQMKKLIVMLQIRSWFVDICISENPVQIDVEINAYARLQSINHVSFPRMLHGSVLNCFTIVVESSLFRRTLTIRSQSRFRNFPALPATSTLSLPLPEATSQTQKKRNNISDASHPFCVHSQNQISVSWESTLLCERDELSSLWRCFKYNSDGNFDLIDHPSIH